jgi:TfoX/Sxy family transcriptional regulator of competence genes
MAETKTTWHKSPSSLVALFDAVLPDDPRVERRQMFGYPCAFVNGNMFTGLHQESLIVRLDEADRARMKSDHQASVFEPMPGRPMREYISLPEAILDDEAMTADWVRRALDFAAALPPKQKKPRKAKRKRE